MLKHIFVRSIGRSVVDENDLIVVRIEILMEERIEDATEQSTTIVRAQLHRDEWTPLLGRHATSDGDGVTDGVAIARAAATTRPGESAA
jgi:hypothetical protein